MAKRRQRDQKVALARRATINADKLEPGVLGVFQRLAASKSLTVDKLGELIRLQERILDREASAAFDEAFRIMSPKIPRISKRGKILNKAGETQSRYARYEDIRKVVDPILIEHGFTLHTRTEWPTPGVAEIVGELVHNRGGRRFSRFQSSADASGGKNAIQGLGSAVSYGKRYVTKDLLAIVEEGEDDDGQTAGKQQKHAREQQNNAREQTPAAHHPEAGAVITDKQRRRLFAIVTNSGRSDGEVKIWLEKRYGWTSTAQITRDRYDAVCEAIEAPGVLS